MQIARADRGWGAGGEGRDGASAARLRHCAYVILLCLCMPAQHTRPFAAVRYTVLLRSCMQPLALQCVRSALMHFS